SWQPSKEFRIRLDRDGEVQSSFPTKPRDACRAIPTFVCFEFGLINEWEQIRICAGHIGTVKMVDRAVEMISSI
ncbi:hypothetical protein ACLOJK_020218, partial [Asimina triloba]